MFQKVCMLYKNHLPCSKAINHNPVPREISITPWCSHVGFWLGISLSSNLMSHTEILILSTNPNYRLSRFLMQNGWCTIMRPKTVLVHIYRFRPGNQASSFAFVNYDILVYSWYGIFYLKAVLLQAKKIPIIQLFTQSTYLKQWDYTGQWDQQWLQKRQAQWCTPSPQHMKLPRFRMLDCCHLIHRKWPPLLCR